MRNWNLLSLLSLPPPPPPGATLPPQACRWPPLCLDRSGLAPAPAHPAGIWGPCPCLSWLSLWPDWKQKMTKSVFFFFNEMLLLEEPQASLVVGMSGLEGILRQRPLLASAPSPPTSGGAGGAPLRIQTPPPPQGLPLPRPPECPPQARVSPGGAGPLTASARAPCGRCSSSDQTPGRSAG